MDDPLIYGLLFFLLLLFLTLKSAFSYINQLQLELDKSKANYHSHILNFIGKRTTEFSITINTYLFIVLTALILSVKADFLVLFHSLSYPLFNLLFVVILGILIFPGLVIFPKTLGEYFSNEIINFSAIPLMIFYILLFPFTKLISLISITSQIIHKNNVKEELKTDFDRDDLNRLVFDSQKHIEDKEGINSEVKLFKNALEFSQVKIRECMIPRTEITAVELNEINQEVKSIFIETGYSKILVYKESIENIIGYMKSKSLFVSDSDYKNNIKDIKYFPESMPANKLLRYFIRTGQNIAVVVDEFGGTSGIVTIEDILEEIFGEIQDEHDTDDLFEKKLSEKDFVFAGRLEIDYINDKYHLNIPTNEEYETIAGFILYHTESLPKANDQIIIDPYNIRILKVSDTRLELLKLELTSNQT
ncbi:MAG: hypothetical protein C0597_01800 [Marinilabiliales bacterium]|nr:MAG: hypothetical protein C0597_01800 [Marinilabiliales bacterium]